MDSESNNQSESGGEGSWLERLTGRSLGDIRIHDSAQAGELARRLGARAFTVGRDIYVRPELVNTKTPEGEALLAHEVTHAAEQTGAPVSDMPLLRPHLHRGGSSAGSGASGGGVAVQRASASGSGSPAPASLSSSEVTAEAVESSTLQSASAPQSGGGGGGGGAQSQEKANTQSSSQPNAEEVAERVYALMVKEMIIDIERSAQL